MLKDMPVDILKIDLKFLSSAQKEDNGRGGNILNSVVRMAKWLHIPVIAEGVESQQQVDFLRTIGCECVQGYFYSKPVPIDVYEDLVDKGHQEMATAVHLNSNDTADMMTMSAQLTILFNSSVGAIGLYELIGRDLEILRANDGYFKMFGDSRQHVYSPHNDIAKRILAEDRAKFWQAVENAKTDHEIKEVVYRRQCTDGRVLWLRTRVSIIYTEEQRTLLYLVMEDISALANERERLRSIMNELRELAPEKIAKLEDDLDSALN